MFTTIIEAIRHAMATKSSVSFTYKGTPRDVQPYSFRGKGETLSLAAYDVAAGTIKTYRLDRMETHPMATGATFDPVWPVDPRVPEDE